MEDQEIDLRELVRSLVFVVKKKMKLIVLITLVSVFCAAIVLLLQGPKYESSVIIQLAKIDNKPVESAESLEILLKNPIEPYLKVLINKFNIAEKDIPAFAESFNLKVMTDKELIDKGFSEYVKISATTKKPEFSKEIVDCIRDTINFHENELIDEAMRIKRTEIDDLKRQVDTAEKDIEKMTAKSITKENTSVVAQAYVYQSIIAERDTTIALRNSLKDKLRSKEMDMNYYTKSVKVVAESTVPKSKIRQHRLQSLLIISFVFLFVALLLSIAIDYFENNPMSRGVK